MTEIWDRPSYEAGYKAGTLSVRQEMIQHDEAYEKGRADERTKMIDELVNAIDEDNYCMLNECPYYQHCGFNSCPIDSETKVIIQTWLKKLKEQKNETEKI